MGVDAAQMTLARPAMHDRLLQPVPAGDRRAAHQVLQPCVSGRWAGRLQARHGRGRARGAAEHTKTPCRGWAKRCPASDNEVIEIRQVQEMEDFPADVQKATAGFSEMQAASGQRKRS